MGLCVRCDFNQWTPKSGSKLPNFGHAEQYGAAVVIVTEDEAPAAHHFGAILKRVVHLNGYLIRKVR